MSDHDSVRLDQWLWAARFYKTRALAKAAIENGQVLVNDQRTKPARPLKPGDRLHIDKHGAQIYDLIVEKSEASASPRPLRKPITKKPLTASPAAANCKRNSAPPANSCNTPNAARTNATAGKSAPSATAVNNRPALASRYT